MVRFLSLTVLSAVLLAAVPSVSVGAARTQKVRFDVSIGEITQGGARKDWKTARVTGLACPNGTARYGFYEYENDGAGGRTWQLFLIFKCPKTGSLEIRGTVKTNATGRLSDAKWGVYGGTKQFAGYASCGKLGNPTASYGTFSRGSASGRPLIFKGTLRPARTCSDYDI